MEIRSSRFWKKIICRVLEQPLLDLVSLTLLLSFFIHNSQVTFCKLGCRRATIQRFLPVVDSILRVESMSFFVTQSGLNRCLSSFLHRSKNMITPKAKKVDAYKPYTQLVM